jgi:hypothetical protein
MAEKAANAAAVLVAKEEQPASGVKRLLTSLGMIWIG